MLQFGMPVQVDDVKSTNDGWTVSGYGSTFNNVDLGNDVVMPGAFQRTLDSGAKVRFLHSHDPRMVLGVPKSLREDKKGLFGEFKISRTKLGEDTRQLLKDGALDSFSIGYIPKEFEWADSGDVRQLKEVELVEVSIVSMPMNPEAVVTNVKDYLASLGIDADTATDPPTLADEAKQLNTQLSHFLEVTQRVIDSLSEKDRPLRAAKRQELADLLERLEQVDTVRHGLRQVLATPTAQSLVGVRRLQFELGERRKRLAPILQEQ